MTKQTLIGEGVEFVRTRRITGYLANVDRFNNAKRSELNQRVKHGLIESCSACETKHVAA